MKNIAPADKIKHIYIIWQENEETIKKIDGLKDEEKKLTKENKSEAEMSEKADKSFEALKTTIASEIKKEANFNAGYNKKVFWDKFLQVKTPVKSEIKDLDIVKKTIVSEQKEETTLRDGSFVF